MPHRANRQIVEEMVKQGWFGDPRREDLPSDNWWMMKDARQRDVLVYVVRFSAGSQQGEPKRIPNTPALPELARLQEKHALTAGPFIALAEVSDSGLNPEILSLRVWRLYSDHLSGSEWVRTEDLGRPAFEC